MDSNVVLPKELRLAAPATMPQSRSYMFKQQAALSNYAPRDTIQINLPRLQRSYLTKDSYLEFEVSFTYKPTAAEVSLSLDTPGALGLIDRIEVYDYLGSTQLESTSGFGQLVALLQDTCVNANEFGTHWEATCGGQTPTITSDWERWGASATNAGSYQGGLYRMTQPTTGEIIDNGTFKDPLTNAAYADLTTLRTIRRRYHLPLFSFLGLLSPKYAPLHNGYTLMITLQSAENALCSVGVNFPTAGAVTGAAAKFGTDASFTVTNARMCCQILELGPIAESMLLSTTGGQPMIVTTKAYRNYNTALTAGTSNFRLDLNINVASLTNVLWIMRPQSFLSSTQYNSLSQRQRNFLESWYFQYGSSVLPQTQGITAFKPTSNNVLNQDNGSECFIELLKARHMYNQPMHYHVFNKFNYAYDNYTRFRQMILNKAFGSVPNAALFFQYADPATFYEKGKFAAGLDLELVSGRTNEIICGMNTNGMNTSIFGTFNAKAASTTSTDSDKALYFDAGVRVEAVRVDAWCEYDAFINVSPGIATTVSF
jgi:hypothetical protein